MDGFVGAEFTRWWNFSERKAKCLEFRDFLISRFRDCYVPKAENTKSREFALQQNGNTFR
jgi:hypothetical protein